MSLYDTVHFAVDVHPHPGSFPTTSNITTAAQIEAESEWNLISSIPSSYGRARLGTGHAMFMVTSSHLTHCLQAFYIAIAGLRDPATDEETWHQGHCLNYFRQSVLCGAETSLEEGDFLDAVLSEEDAELLPLEERAERRPRDDGLNASTPGPDGSWHPGRIRGELVCKDWDAYYNDMELNWQQWLDWAEEWN